MKLTSAALCVAAICDTAAAAVATARVFTYDPRSGHSSHGQPGVLDAVPARVVLAQRLGVEEYHSADLDRQDVIDAINTYGSSTPLFAEETGQAKKALLLLQSSEEATFSLLHAHESYRSESVPYGEASTGLFVDLTKQMDVHEFDILDDSHVMGMIGKPEAYKTASGDLIWSTSSETEFEKTFLRLARQDNWAITALAISPRTGSGSVEEASAWGTYDMPSGQSALHKRSTTVEKPLTETPRVKLAAASSAPVSPAANTTLVRGILPACFKSQAACEKATQGCSNHGKCKLKYHDKTAALAVDCYSCSCTPTKSKDGKVTTKWGGPACQKKDISIEFWLIALFTIGLIFVIGFAIGQIAEMGNQELPSVIGAGVSGPSARR